MSCIQNESILENLYDEVWEDYRKSNNLTLDQMYHLEQDENCLLYTSPSPRDATLSRMPSSA